MVNKKVNIRQIMDQLLDLGDFSNSFFKVFEKDINELNDVFLIYKEASNSYVKESNKYKNEILKEFSSMKTADSHKIEGYENIKIEFKKLKKIINDLKHQISLNNGCRKELIEKIHDNKKILDNYISDMYNLKSKYVKNKLINSKVILSDNEILSLHKETQEKYKVLKEKFNIFINKVIDKLNNVDEINSSFNDEHLYNGNLDVIKDIMDVSLIIEQQEVSENIISNFNKIYKENYKSKIKI